MVIRGELPQHSYAYILYIVNIKGQLEEIVLLSRWMINQFGFWAVGYRFASGTVYCVFLTVYVFS